MIKTINAQKLRSEYVQDSLAVSLLLLVMLGIYLLTASFFMGI